MLYTHTHTEGQAEWSSRFKITAIQVQVAVTGCDVCLATAAITISVPLMAWNVEHCVFAIETHLMT